jgi:homocysteine S-methyltransferase
MNRIRAVRVNASALSHAELDAATELDEGNPAELGSQCAALQAALPHLLVVGGCCGTDTRHAEAIARQCTTAKEPS